MAEYDNKFVSIEGRLVTLEIKVNAILAISTAILVSTIAMLFR